MLARSQLGRFILAPSIDLLGGRVVRLRHGDPTHPTVYDTDPTWAARRWAQDGADLLHVVDLDGALAGWAAQVDRVADLISAGLEAGIPSQVAGGIRDEDAVERALAAGAERVVLGTALLGDAGLAGRLVARHGSSRIAAALDVRDGAAVGEGWRSGAARLPLDLAVTRLQDAGITTIAVTSIARDGTMEGPDLGLLGTVRRLAPDVRLFGSAGVRSASDVLTMRNLGCDGAILGRAAYEGLLTIAHARAALDNPEGD
jgi:phosphoribosylformimino-5-aminoimidazole carboxamide ribotide isomerase